MLNARLQESLEARVADLNLQPVTRSAPDTPQRAVASQRRSCLLQDWWEAGV